MKVLQIARQFHPSMAGVERFVMDLCKHLIQSGIKCDVVTLNRCFYMDGELPALEVVNGIQVNRIPFWGGQRFFFAPEVLRFVRDYDVLHVHNVDFFSDFLILTKFIHRKPVIVSTHGGYFHTSRLAFVKKIYFNTITRVLLPGADKVIAVSEHDRSLFEKIVPGIQRIDNGVDFSRLADVQKQITSGLLLYIGRLVSNKRIDLLIRTLALVRQHMPEAQLVLVGPDFEGMANSLQELAQTLGVLDAVTFAGQVSDETLAAWLSKANAFVTASEYEAFGISVLEAMSTGTVPVVNRLASFQHFIQDGRNGFFTDFSNPDQAAQIIIRLLKCESDKIYRLGQNARNTAAGYSWDKIVAQFIDTYRELIG